MNVFKKAIVAAAVLFSIGLTTEIQALEATTSPEQPEGYENLMNCMCRKLGRGVVNVGFGALEVPIRVMEVNFNEGGLAALTFGTFSGLGYCIAREFVGLFEIVTFPFPLPNLPNDPYGYGKGYGPILTPEWVVTPETNYYNIFYTKGAFVH